MTDLSRWAEVVRQWVLSGFRKQNVAGMLDWYTQGIPQRGGDNNPWSAAGKLLGFQGDRSGNRSGGSQTSRYQETPEETARLDAEWEMYRQEAQGRRTGSRGGSESDYGRLDCQWGRGFSRFGSVRENAYLHR